MLVNLHAHTDAGSYDGGLSPEQLARVYRAAGFGAVAITDHDVVTEPPAVDGIHVLRGIEHTVDARDHLHVVELVDHGFSFLAHPAFSFGDDRIPDAVEWAQERGLEGIERFNGGTRQMADTVQTPLLELANDDAHNPVQVGHSFMVVPDGLDERGVVDAIRSGQFHLVRRNRPFSRLVGFFMKGLAYGTKQMDRTVRRMQPPDRGTAVYDHPR